MNILKRIANLWHISEYAQITHEENGDAILTIRHKKIKPNQMAQIIEREDSLDLFPNNEEENGNTN